MTSPTAAPRPFCGNVIRQSNLPRQLCGSRGAGSSGHGALCQRTQSVAGWFDKTLPRIRIEGGIALLRLDADWYESTMTCLEALYSHVVPGGLVIVDN